MCISHRDGEAKPKQVLRQALDIAPGNEEAHLDLARLYEERRDARTR